MNKIIALLWLKSVSDSKYSYLYYILFRLFAYMEQINIKICNIIMREKPEIPYKAISHIEVEILTEKDKPSLTSSQASLKPMQESNRDTTDHNQCGVKK